MARGTDARLSSLTDRFPFARVDCQHRKPDYCSEIHYDSILTCCVITYYVLESFDVLPVGLRGWPSRIGREGPESQVFGGCYAEASRPMEIQAPAKALSALKLL